MPDETPKKPRKTRPTATPVTPTFKRRVGPPVGTYHRPQPQLEEELNEEGFFGGDFMDPAEQQEAAVSDWLAESVLSKNYQTYTLRLALVQAAGAYQIDEWGSDDFTDREPRDIAGMLYERAADDAKNNSGVSRYSISAHAPDGRLFTSFGFKVYPTEAARGDTENPASADGLLSQTYRHNEQLIRAGAILNLQTIRQNENLVAEVRRLHDQLFEQRVKTVTLFEQMENKKMLRDIMLKKVARGEWVKDQALELVKKFGPHLARRIGLMTDDDVLSMQTNEAVANWIGAMSDANIGIMLKEVKDPKERQAFERAVIISKAKAAKNQAKAALGLGGVVAGALGAGSSEDKKDAANNATNTTNTTNGTTAGTNSGTNGEATTSPDKRSAGDEGGANGVAAAAAAGDGGTIHFHLEDDEVKLLRRVIKFLVLDLICAGLDDTAFGYALSSVPPWVHETLKHVRGEVQAGQKPDFKSEAGKLRANQLGSAVMEMLAEASEAQLGMLLMRVDDKARGDVVKMRTVAQAKISAAQP